MAGDAAAPEDILTLTLRTRVEPFKGTNEWHEVTLEREMPAAETVLILCDVWDRHWSRGASERVDILAPRIDRFARAARERGVFVIHAPSDTMGFYRDHPARRRMTELPAAEPPEPVEIADPPLPIDDSDGGSDTGETSWYPAWTRQHPAIEIRDEDGISDDGQEVYSLLHRRGIRNLLIAGVHTNMCVLNRSFGIRAMARRGVRCVLARDLTDSMYNPRMPPFVSHDEGTELVIRHIEKYWCPTMHSGDLAGGA